MSWLPRLDLGLREWLEAARRRSRPRGYSDSDLGDRLRGIVFWALVAVIIALGAGYGVVILNEVQSGGGGAAQVLAFRTTQVAGSNSNVAVCGQDIDLDEGNSTILKFDSQPLEGYELTAVDLKPSSPQAPQGVVQATAQDRLSVLIAASHTDDELNPPAVYALSVTFSRGDAQVISRCNVRLMAVAEQAPGEVPTEVPAPQVIRARIIPPATPTPQPSGQAQPPTQPVGTLGIIPAGSPQSGSDPTRTPDPSNTPRPNSTTAPSSTAVPPTSEPPTSTPVPPTSTPEPPTATPEPPTATPEPPTATPEPPTATSEPPTATPEPTATPVDTPIPEPTPVDTPIPEPTPVDTPIPEPTPVDTPIPEPTPVTRRFLNQHLWTRRFPSRRRMGLLCWTTF